jgi:hypothetical protein
MNHFLVDVFVVCGVFVEDRKGGMNFREASECMGGTKGDENSCMTRGTVCRAICSLAVIANPTPISTDIYGFEKK